MKTFLSWIVIGIVTSASASFVFAQNTLAQGQPSAGSASAAVASNQAQQRCSALLNQQELMDSRAVQLASIRLYRNALIGPKVTAMFVTYKDGEFAFVRFNGEETREKAVWKGPLPECTVAVIHTHPAGSSARPCRGEYDLANGKQTAILRIQVYVLHQKSITKAMPGSSAAISVREIGWLNDLAQKNGEQLPVLARQVNKSAGSARATGAQ